MDLGQGNGRSGGVGVLPSIIAEPLFCPGSESGALRIVCLNVRGCNEVEKGDEIGSMFEECKLDILGLNETKLRVLEVSNLG